MLVWFRRNGKPLALHDVARISFRVLPTDLDVLGHLNNGMYLSIMDLGRLDLLRRSGAWRSLAAAGIYPVIANETISFRRSLMPWQRFTIESRIVGYDAKAVFMEQRFVVAGEIYAQALIRGRFIRKSGGTVGLSEIIELTGADVASLVLPEWAERWAEDVALPPAKQQAPSLWSQG